MALMGPCWRATELSSEVGVARRSQGAGARAKARAGTSERGSTGSNYGSHPDQKVFSQCNCVGESGEKTIPAQGALLGIRASAPDVSFNFNFTLYNVHSIVSSI
jgi:hypothetical protein